MKALLQFSDVAYEKITSLSFILAEGEICVLKTAGKEEKVAIMELALGEKAAADGAILFRGKPLEAAAPGTIGWIPANGGLIGNLKAWENITLPLWYHGKRILAAAEKEVERWLLVLEPDRHEWTDFMASSSARLITQERKLAGLLRGLVLAPQLLVVDAALFDNVDQASCRSWIAALEMFVREIEGRALLAVSDGTTPLPWKTIEEEN